MGKGVEAERARSPASCRRDGQGRGGGEGTIVQGVGVGTVPCELQT